MELILKIGEWLLSKFDPTLVLCLLVLAFWQHKTSKLIGEHLDVGNQRPHPQCREHEAIYADLKSTIGKHHNETREDIQGLGSRIDTVLKIAIKE
jgi:hypothetical protein